MKSASWKPMRAIKKAQAHLHRDDGRADRGEQFQREGGEEGDLQNLQGGAAELITDGGDILDLGFGLTEELERGQPLQAVEEVRG